MSENGLRTSYSVEELRELSELCVGEMQQLHSSLFSNAVNYTNTIILAGYAGAFTIWGIIKDSINAVNHAVIGLLLCSSIIVFVSFEIYKMVKMAWVQVAFVKDMSKTTDPVSKIELIAALKNVEDKARQSLMVTWFFCFVICVLLGFSAGLILIWELMTVLISAV
jgi:hypothetical protein